MAPLEILFDAAIAREEEVAADDLAISLDQDRTSRDVLSRARGVSLVDQHGVGIPVEGAGRDYVWTAGPTRSFIRLDQAIFRLSGTSRPPVLRDDMLIDRLRELARAGASVQVTTKTRTVIGRLTRARRDHLQLEESGLRTLVPYECVVGVRVTRGG